MKHNSVDNIVDGSGKYYLGTIPDTENLWGFRVAGKSKIPFSGLSCEVFVQ